MVQPFENSYLTYFPKHGFHFSGSLFFKGKFVLSTDLKNDAFKHRILQIYLNEWRDSAAYRLFQDFELANR